MTQNFEKIYVLDTNIILNNAYNLLTLADSGKNLIVLPEIVLDELDDKKNGLEEINFQARQFSGLLKTADIIGHEVFGDIAITTVKVQGNTIFMVTKDSYKADKEQMSTSIRNDRKILEVTEDLMKMGGHKDLIFISLDVMARTRAISLGITTEALTLGKVDVDADVEFHNKLEIPEYLGDVFDIPKQEDKISSVEIVNKAGKPFIYFRTRTGWELIQEKNPLRLAAPPINKRQKVMTGIILDGADVTVVAGPAGTGKTLVAVSTAMKLIDIAHKEKKKFKKIYYIRRTVISGSKEDEVGFLPGTLEEKMMGYNQPMEDSIKKIAQMKKRGATKEVIEDTMDDLKEKYEIEYLYAGHLRGSTLEEGSILICDEVQNWDITSIRTIFSRMGDHSCIIAMGSNNQIDSQYLTRNTNALTFLMNKAGKENSSDIRVEGVRLNKVMRSKLAEWADEELY